MDVKGDLHRLNFFGSTTVSSKGQMVIPANARKELGINSGDTLLVCGPPQVQGLLLLKVETVEQILSVVAEQLASFGRLVSDYRTTKATDSKE